MNKVKTFPLHPDFPKHDILSQNFIYNAQKCDRCSCSPDFIHVDNKEIYIGNACYLHDLQYDWIRANIKPWRVRERRCYYDIADWQLRRNIEKIGEALGADLREEAYTYWAVLHSIGPVFRFFASVGRLFGRDDITKPPV